MASKPVGYIVLYNGVPLVDCKNIDRALVPCRVGEAPRLFDNRPQARTAIRFTRRKFGGEAFEIVPIVARECGQSQASA